MSEGDLDAPTRPRATLVGRGDGGFAVGVEPSDGVHTPLKLKVDDGVHEGVADVFLGLGRKRDDGGEMWG